MYYKGYGAVKQSMGGNPLVTKNLHLRWLQPDLPGYVTQRRGINPIIARQVSNISNRRYNYPTNRNQYRGWQRRHQERRTWRWTGTNLASGTITGYPGIDTGM